ncbi:MAG: hypothetical protein IKL78_06100 [Lachnospiraceae bacterium]|nr:hypothetical protein [Lachnospiraceae bacterium]
MKKRSLLIVLMAFMLTGCNLKEEVSGLLNQGGESKDVQVDELTEEEVEEIRLEAGLTDSAVSDFEPSKYSRYYYDTLSDKEKEIYAEMYLVLQNCATDVTLSTLDKDEIDTVFSCVLYDNPDIFYVDGYSCTQITLNGELTRIEFSPTYTYTESEVQGKRSDIENKVNELLQGVSADDSEYDKIKYVYETVVEETQYVVGAKDNQNICSVFLNGESVCQGYAKSSQYLLNSLGVTATLVTGSIKDSGEGHAWTLVWIDNEPYYLDATWGDASYTLGSDGAAAQNVPEISYDYLNITTAELEKTHVVANISAVPECTATENNYYVKEGSYFTEVDKNQLETLFDDAYEAGNSYVTIKCADENVYEDMKAYLIDEQAIFDYLKGDNVSYSYNQAALTYSFWI